MFFELFFHIGVLYLSARLAKLEAERLAQGEAKVQQRKWKGPWVIIIIKSPLTTEGGFEIAY